MLLLLLLPGTASATQPWKEKSDSRLSFRATLTFSTRAGYLFAALHESSKIRAQISLHKKIPLICVRAIQPPLLEVELYIMMTRADPAAAAPALFNVFSP